MADGITLNAGSDGSTLATDDIAGMHYQIVKLSYGALDSATVVDTTNRFPTSAAQSGTWNIGTVTTVTAVTAISNALPAGTNNIGDVDVLTVPSDPFGANADVASATGSISAKLRFIAATGIPVTSLPNVTLAAGTNTNEVVGDVAQDAAVAGNPVLMGGRASTATPTAMSADGDSVYVWLTRNGAQVVSGEIVDDAAFTPGTTRVQPIGLQADETSTDSVDEGDAGCPRMTLDRKQIVTVHPHTQGGLSTASGSITTTVTAVKASAGQLYGYHIYNPNASVVYVQLFDLATGSVTLGTTMPKLSLGIPASSGAVVAIPQGIAFATAISVAITTTRAGSSAPGSSVDYNFEYF